MKKELLVTVVFFTIIFYDYNQFGAQMRGTQTRWTVMNFLPQLTPVLNCEQSFKWKRKQNF